MTATGGRAGLTPAPYYQRRSARPYGIYAACALLSLLFVLKFIQETKGKELEDMDGGAVATGH